MVDLITIGDATFDTFLVLDEHSKQVALHKKKNELALNYADKICIDETHQSLGGNATNMAMGARRLGHHVAIVTELGDDLTGHVILDELADHDIDTSLVQVHKNKSSRFSMVLNYASERTILSYHAERHYTLPKLPRSRWIYYTSLGKTFPTLQKKLIQYLKKNPNIQVAMNPGSFQLHYPEILQQILPYISVLFVNKEEAATISGKKGTIKQRAKALHALGAKTVVITDGIHGAYCYDENKLYHMPCYPIEPIAKTGAGDAFASGFLSALMHNHDCQTALQWGTANASSVIQIFGAQEGLLTRSGIQRMLKQFPKVLPRIR